MSATIKGMEYAFVDILNIDQLMENDLIEIDEEVVQVIAITSLPSGFAIGYQNEFGEKDIQEFDDYATFKLFVIR
jgi:hypothetical protein